MHRTYHNLAKCLNWKMLLLELGLILNLYTKYAGYMTHINLAMVSDLEYSGILVCM